MLNSKPEPRPVPAPGGGELRLTPIVGAGDGIVTSLDLRLHRRAAVGGVLRPTVRD